MADACFWFKIAFCIIAFFEAFITGLIPTWSKSCRESPKVLGIANSFAGGVFLAIAFVHILPEMAEAWTDLESEGKSESELEELKIFPLPYLLVIVGYTFILILDKVLFDTHALFDHDHEDEEDGVVDPAEKKFRENLKASFANVAAAEATGDANYAKRSMIKADTDLKENMKEYLDKSSRFATRMKASGVGKSGASNRGVN
jgi:zinc transporter ZupT